MKVLYLHIGTPKTGTTAIQRFMYENRELLLKNGVSYEAPPYKFKRIGISRNAHFLFGEIYDKDGNEDVEKMAEVKEAGLRFVLERFGVCDKVVLSDEILFVRIANGSDVIEKLKGWADEHGILLKIIVYLRRQDKYAESLWKQAVKQSVTYMKFREYIETERFIPQTGYYEILEKISAAVGKENVYVRRFDRKYFPEGKIQADFLGIVGLDYPGEYKLGQEVRNESTDNNYTEILRNLNSLSETPMLRFNKVNKFFAGIAVRMSKKDDDKTSQLSAAGTREYMEKFREGNKKLAAGYFGKKDGPWEEGKASEDADELFLEDTGDPPAWSKDSRAYSEAVLKYFGQGTRELWERIERLK